MVHAQQHKNKIDVKRSGKNMVEYHITIKDKKQDAKNLKGSGKGKKHSHRKINKKDRKIDRRNAKKAKGW